MAAVRGLHYYRIAWLFLRAWKCAWSICYKNSSWKRRERGTLAQRDIPSNKVLFRSRNFNVLYVDFKVLTPFTFSSRGNRNQMRNGDQLMSNCASIKVNSPLSRVDSKSLHWTCRRKSDGRARFQFCHDITSNGEHACIANTEEKKEKSYHNQCHNQKSRHSWNVSW